MSRLKSFFAPLLLVPALAGAAGVTYEPGTVAAPPPAREFRAAWIATVANIDWPSKPGLPVAQQKAELVSLLDRAVQLHLNAVVFQVRPMCDALYASPLEPWSEYLTGTMGRAPQPFYDPLAFAVAEAHARGLELHAWFNPYRAGHPQAKSPPSPNYVTQKHPELVRHYGPQTWLDPGDPATQTRTMNVVLDVVKRYDVDGVQFDDYFYPYPEKNSLGQEINFPDALTWKKYGLPTGLAYDDWRRANVDSLIQRLYVSIKAAKPWVQFGISPFGIWRPENPPQIRGFDPYEKIYANARKWLASGWVDYLAPQLYWPVAQREQSFPVLLQWWRTQNVKGRHVFAGMNDSAVGTKFSTEEIARQISAVREQTSQGGEIHFHLRSITDNPTLAAAVRAQYAQPALVPPSPWLGAIPPDKPKMYVSTVNGVTSVRWAGGGNQPARWWLLQSGTGGYWTTEILPPTKTDHVFSNVNPDAIVVRAVDRLGNLSEPAVLVPRKYTPAAPTAISPAAAPNLTPAPSAPAPVPSSLATERRGGRK